MDNLHFESFIDCHEQECETPTSKLMHSVLWLVASARTAICCPALPHTYSNYTVGQNISNVRRSSSWAPSLDVVLSLLHRQDTRVASQTHASLASVDFLTSFTRMVSPGPTRASTCTQISHSNGTISSCLQKPSATKIFSLQTRWLILRASHGSGSTWSVHSNARRSFGFSTGQSRSI